jgi:hypothetical protein
LDGRRQADAAVAAGDEDCLVFKAFHDGSPKEWVCSHYRIIDPRNQSLAYW